MSALNISSTPQQGTPPDGSIGVTSAAGAPAAVFVLTRSGSGAFADQVFHVVAIC